MQTYDDGYLRSRPKATQAQGSVQSGYRRIGLDTERDGLLYVPAWIYPQFSASMLLTLHGAGGDAHHGLDPFRELDDRTGTILFAP